MGVCVKTKKEGLPPAVSELYQWLDTQEAKNYHHYSTIREEKHIISTVSNQDSSSDEKNSTNAIQTTTQLRENLGIFQALGNRGFRLLWISGFLVSISRWMDMVVMGWLVLELTDSYLLLGIVAASRMAPMLVFGLIAGVAADRLNRRKLVMTAWIMKGLLYSLMVFLIATGVIQFWHIVAISFLNGTSATFDWVNRRALISDLVDKGDLSNAIALEISAMYATGIIGGLTGGVFITLIGVSNSYYIMVGMLGVAILLLLRIGPISRVSTVAIESIWKSLAQGFSYVRTKQAMVAVLAVTVVMNAFLFPYIQLLPIFARDVLDIGPKGLGILAASPPAGALISSLTLASMGKLKRPGLIFLIGSISAGGILVLFSLSNYYALSVTLLVTAGIMQAFFAVLQSTILLSLASVEMRGRVMGLLSICIGAMPLGIFGAGAIAELTGAPYIVRLGGAVSAVAVFIILLLTPSLRRL